MRKSVLVALLLGAALVACMGSAYAAHLPTHGDVVHFDLNAGGAYDTLFPWPGIPAAPNPVVGGNPPTFAGSFEGGEFVQFTDALQSFQLHMWENEIRNQSSIRRTFKLLIQDRDPGVLNRWFYVTLDPGWSIVIDLHVDEGVLDMGAHTWLAASLLKYQIGVDSSVTENKLFKPHPFPFPCNVNTDGCLAVNFADPSGNLFPPNLATGGLVVQRQFSGCPDVFLLKANSRIRVPWFAKLRCQNGVLVLLVGDQVVQQLYPAPPP